MGKRGEARGGGAVLGGGLRSAAQTTPTSPGSARSRRDLDRPPESYIGGRGLPAKGKGGIFTANWCSSFDGWPLRTKEG